jgi:dihydroorotate dehydrogenase
MYPIVKSFLFLFDPEKAHHISINLLHFLLKIPGVKWVWRKRFSLHDKRLERRVFGINFPNPVGLAAGFDKNATLFNDLKHVGFGFIEIGTVTPKPQDGNEKPRLFRLKKDHAIINRMGFNNDGVDAIVSRLKNDRGNLIIGGNIGKNKITPNENAVSDYLICYEKLFPYVDYFVVNVSSPNTPNLRALQEKEPLKELLFAICIVNSKKELPKPILLKIAPDLSESQLDDIIEIVNEVGLDGVIATNTTIQRDGLKTTNEALEKIGNGGLSGLPIKDKSTEIIRYLHTKSKGKFPIIGVGGIHSAEDAVEKIKAGASLVQIYTGFIYEGPGLIKRINRKILEETVNL